MPPVDGLPVSNVARKESDQNHVQDQSADEQRGANHVDPAPVAERQTSLSPGSDDSVIAVDDHLEGTFTSRGTVVVKGSVKGRIEAVQIRIEDGARVDADVIVDEAIVAGEFTGNLTCRERLEARSSGRISGGLKKCRVKEISYPIFVADSSIQASGTCG